MRSNKQLKKVVLSINGIVLRERKKIQDGKNICL